MKLNASVLLICCVCLQTAHCRLPAFTPATHPPQSREAPAGVQTCEHKEPKQNCSCISKETSPTGEQVSVKSDSHKVSTWIQQGFSRLPGLCRQLKRRRVTVLCNLERFCCWERNHNSWSGQVCRCPQGFRCSHFFVYSL